MKTAIIILCVCLTAAAAHARMIHVEFSYGDTADGFRLYQNGTQVCEITDGAARQPVPAIFYLAGQGAV